MCLLRRQQTIVAGILTYSFIVMVDHCFVVAEQLKDEPKFGKVLWAEDYLSCTLSPSQVDPKRLIVTSQEVDDC